MMKLSRGAWIAIAAVVAVPVTVAVAKTVEHRGWHNMSPEARSRLDEGKLAMAKTALKLTPDQEKLWAPIETQVRAVFKDREARMAERKAMRDKRKADRAAGQTSHSDGGKKGDMAERFEKMSQKLTQRAERMNSFSDSFKPFYASLSDEQKEVLRPLVRQLMPGMGGRGHKGPRWAHGGWGGKDGHHGGWGRGHGRHHGDRGDGEHRGMMDDAGETPVPPAAAPPVPAPQP